jgi:tRNA(Ile)-lysidine synthase
MFYQNKRSNLLNAFLGFLQKNQLLKSDEATLLAVSGGIDSIVMAALFKHAQLKFAIAHCNFGLRGTASEEDDQFVGRLAQAYQVDYYTKRFDTQAYAQQHRLSIQMAARKLRYEWFETIRSQHLFKWIATAHHQDDVLETLLLNLIKGTSIAGLHGILPRKGNLIRPLLFANKNSLWEYAQQEQLTWREDASNTADTYQRNLLRNQVIPVLQSINPNLVHTTQVTVERLAQVELIFQEQLALIKQQIFHTLENTHEILVELIQDQPWTPVVLWELLRPFGFNFIQIKNLLQSNPQSGKAIYSPTYTLYVDRNKWVLTARLPSTKNLHIIPNETPHILDTFAYIIQTNVLIKDTYVIQSDNRIAALDLDFLKFPLTIRRWQPGDFFYPLGMQQRKKVSDFLVDLKVPRPYKDQIDVLLSGNQIAWIIGYRIDNRFRIQPHTRKVYELQLFSKSPN